MSRRGIGSIARDIRQHVLQAEPWGLTFSPTAGLTPGEKKILEQHLKERFKLWTETWVLPDLAEIIRKAEKQKK